MTWRNATLTFSQAQAAAILKIDISELREAKAEGCTAFRSGRVYGSASSLVRRKASAAQN
jgi:hypothetical protein